MFSVIIPVYNAERTLGEALHSVQIQSITDWEAVIVNDGSTDNSISVIRNATKDWDNVTIIEQENCGLGNARNVAAKAAKGEWLVFLDADDYWAGNKLAELSGVIEMNPEADVIYHPIMEKYANGLMRRRRFWEIHTTEDFLKFGNPFVPSAMAMKKSTFLKHGGFIEDRKQVEDLLLWFRLLDARTKFSVSNKPLTVYRMGAGVTANLEEHLQKVFTSFEEAVNSGIFPPHVLAAFKARKYYEAARQLHKMGEFDEAQAYYNRLKEKGLKQQILQSLCKLNIKV